MGRETRKSSLGKDIRAGDTSAPAVATMPTTKDQVRDAPYSGVQPQRQGAANLGNRATKLTVFFGRELRQSSGGGSCQCQSHGQKLPTSSPITGSCHIAKHGVRLPNKAYSSQFAICHFNKGT